MLTESSEGEVRRTLTDKEYRLLLKIYNHRIDKAEDLWPWEYKTLRSLYEKGLVDLAKPEDCEQQVENGEIVLDEHAGSEADGPKDYAKPKLEPGPSRVFTPAFIRRSLRTLLFSLLLSFSLSILLKLLLICA